MICSTILHPLTEVRVQKIFSNGQQAKFVDRILSRDKTKERLFSGKVATVELNSGKSKHFGQQFNHSPSLVRGKRSKKLLKNSKAKFVDCSSIPSPAIKQRNSELEGKLQ